jgi:hypothetical protein
MTDIVERLRRMSQQLDMMQCDDVLQAADLIESLRIELREAKGWVDKARADALEDAARLCDAAEERLMTKLRKLKKPNADLAAAAGVGAADMADKLAGRIRALSQ